VLSFIALASSACSSLPFYRSEEPAKFAYDVKKLEAPQPPAIDIASTANSRRSGQLQSKNLWQRLREGMALDPVDSPVTDKYVAYYSSHPEMINRIFLKAAPFMDYILTEVERRHMPAEIALLPFIESGFDPLAVSRSGARGLWQFTAATGKYYRLRQSRAYDARIDIVSSTNAALDYLQDLYLDMHDNWLLALASYNGGPGYVKSSAKRLGQPLRTLRFKDMVHLRTETRNYVPKLIAISRIIQNPEKYHVRLPEMATRKLITVRKFDYPVDLKNISRQTGVDLNTLRTLNPGFRHTRVDGKGKLALALPREQTAVTPNPVQTAKIEAPAVSVTLPNPVAANQPLVARRFKTDSAAIMNSNTYQPPNASYSTVSHDRKFRRVRPVHRNMGVSESAARFAERKGSQAKRFRNYRIVAGDTLSQIALRYATRVAVLKKINHLRSSLILAGATLKVPLPRTDRDAKVASRETVPARPLNHNSVIYRVGEGDTLAAIAQHYGIDRKHILSVNGMGSPEQLVTGQILTLYPSQDYFARRRQAPEMVKLETYDFSANRSRAASGSSGATPDKPTVPDAGFRPVITYRVGPTDTLSSIARHYHVPVRELSVWNDLRRDITVGQTLEIPPSI